MSRTLHFVRHVFDSNRLECSVVGVLFAICAVAQVFVLRSVAQLVAAPLNNNALPGEVWPFTGLLVVMTGLIALSAGLVSAIGRDVGVAAKMRLIRAVAGADHSTVKAIGAARLRTEILTETEALALATRKVGLMTLALFVLAGLILYIVTLSPVLAFVMGFGLSLMATAVLILGTASAESADRAVSMDEHLAAQVDALRSIAWDVRINAKRADDYYTSAIRPAIMASARLRLLSGLTFNRLFTFIRLTFAIVWGLGQLILIVMFDPFVATQVTLGMIYASLCLYTSFKSYDIVQNGVDALARLEAITEALDARQQRAETQVRTVDRLALEQVVFQHPRSAFRVGPLTHAFHRPETVIIVGSNGSGKSSTLRLLAGLYAEASGQIAVDGLAQGAPERQALFATVFSDFHLFRRAYGYTDDQRTMIEHWLVRLGLEGHVGLDGDRLTTRALSSGQRKRVALALALAEERPVLLLDEWTADQSPTFRRWFYDELLPELKANGRLVILVSHDNRYRRAADTLVEMSNGQFQRIRARPAGGG